MFKPSTSTCSAAGLATASAMPRAQFLPHALEWVWKGYAPKRSKSSSQPMFAHRGPGDEAPQ